MNTSELITEIDADISRLQQVRSLLTGTGNTGTKRRKGKLSAEGRARISAAQKKRWAQRKRAK